METEPLFKGVLFMRETEDGRWAFLHRLELPPITMKDIDMMIQVSDTNFILISKPNERDNGI